MKYLPLDITAINACICLQTIVQNDLQDKTLLHKKSREEYIVMLAQGYTIGLYDDNQLVALRGLVIPEIDSDEHLGDDLGLSSEDKRRVIYSEITLVHPNYRGHGHQHKMGRQLLNAVDERFDYVLSTVYPYNLRSLSDKFKLGFKIYKTCFKYNGKLRHVLMLNLKQHDSRLIQTTRIAYDDIDWMLTNGDHYVGCALENNTIIYTKR